MSPAPRRPSPRVHETTRRTPGCITPGRREAGVLALAVSGISLSAPLIAATAAPAMAIAFWRTAAGAAVFAVVVAATACFRRCRPRTRLTSRDYRLTALAGLCLAAHFGTWIPSLGLTTVAASTALVCTQPVWSAAIARLTGAHVKTGVWAGAVLALTGVMLLVGNDIQVAGSALLGDALALAGGVAGAGYVVLGERARNTLDATRYNLLSFTTAAFALALCAAATGTPLVGFSAPVWWGIAAVTMTGQLLGHALLNHSLKTTDATTVSTVALLEVPAATLLAAVFLSQYPPPSLLLSVVVIAVGITLVVRSRS